MSFPVRGRSLLAVAVLAGCAHIEPPSGGPEDKVPPQVVAVRPDSMARVPGFRGPVVFAFDERISEEGVEEAVLVSPRTSPVSVEKRGDELRVDLRRGWEPGRIYHVTVLPQLRDLFGNTLAQRLNLVFSTGPEIPDTRLSGTVVDRTTGRPDVGTRVEAILRADSLVYATRSDSSGSFAFAHVPEGEYRVRAFRDVDNDRVLDDFEARDTTAATVTTERPATVRLRVLQPDTTPPRVASVEVADSVLRVKFDDFLDPVQRVTPAQVTILLPDSTAVPVASVEIAPAEGAAPAGDPADAPAQERLPSQTILVRPARPLPPETELRVRVRDVWNLHGLVGGGEGTATTPAPAPAAPPPEGEPPQPSS